MMASAKFIVLIIYDIVDNKRRNKMVKCLEAYGVRVQKSAFEALLEQRQINKLVSESSKLIDPIHDSLRIYVLNNVLDVYTWGTGERREVDCVVV